TRTITPDGRYALFLSSASNFIANDMNGTDDAFARDLVSGITTAVSVTPSGSTGNSSSDAIAITPDGGFVLFSTNSTNLVLIPIFTIPLSARWTRSTHSVDELGAQPLSPQWMGPSSQ